MKLWRLVHEPLLSGAFMRWDTSNPNKLKWIIPGLFVGVIAMGIALQSELFEFGEDETGSLSESEADDILKSLSGDDMASEEFTGFSPEDNPLGSDLPPQTEPNALGGHTDPFPETVGSSSNVGGSSAGNPKDPLAGLDLNRDPERGTDSAFDPWETGADQTNTRTAMMEERFPSKPNSNNRETPPSPIQPANHSVESPATIPPELQEELSLAKLMRDNGKVVEAHRELSRLYWLHPEWRDFLVPTLDQTSQQIFFDASPHFLPPRAVKPGEMFGLIAKEYNVPWEYLAKLNRIDLSRVRDVAAGRELKVNHGPFAAVIDLSRLELTIHSHNYFVRRYRIGLGRDKMSPIGSLTVINKTENARYGGQPATTDPSGNSLGVRWIELGNGPSSGPFGIHGTDDPRSVGRVDNGAGCIRMHNREVEVVYDLLDFGSPVIIRR